jgi:glycosyltransferase involved in cell wall biosynthesis
MGGKIKENSIIGRILIKAEHWIYKNSDSLIFLKEGDYTYITDKKWDIPQGGVIDLGKCYYINNGVHIDNFKKQIKNERLEDDDLTNGNFNVVYAGAIRSVNNVGNILDAAKLLKENKDIQFLIYGDGSQLESLRKRVVDEGITNVKMKGYVDKKYIPYVLSKSSVNLLNYSQSKYNWSRGNSSNKLFEYMASGKPIISTVKMGYSPIEKYNCGVSLEDDSSKALAEAVLKIFNMPDEKYQEISKNAKNGVIDFDYGVLTKKLISVIESQLL